MSQGSSPLHKKRRMSSPIYPGFIEDLSPEDLQSLSEIDAAVSQGDCPVAPIRQSNPVEFHAQDSKSSQPAEDKRRTPELGSEAIDDPFTTHALPTSVQLPSDGGTQPGPSAPAIAGFSSVRAMAGNIANGDHRFPSPEGPPPDQDYDAWFNTRSTNVPALVGFQSSSIVTGTGFVGFTSAGKGTSFQPSEDAIQNVRKRMRGWEADIEEELSIILPQSSQLKVTSPHRPVTPPSPTFDSDKNPVSPTPTTSRLTSSQNTTLARYAKQKPFKPPLLSNKANLTNSVPASPPKPTHSKGSVPPFKPPLLPSASTPNLPKPVTSSKVTSVFRAPARPGEVQRPGSVKKFTTPFKPGMRPGEPGRAKLQGDQGRERLQALQKDKVFQMHASSPPRKPVYDVPPSLKSPPASRKGKEKAKEYQFFDLTSPPNRQTLATCGQVPQSHSRDELKSMGVNFEEMSQITPETAVHYSFYSPSGHLGPAAAFEELLNAGCTLATEDWVHNHWGLILWKQAGMLCLDPTEAQRWSWKGTINQLRYRYEKELQGGSRPPFKLIATGDSPPSCPMVLCISNVIWTQGHQNPDGTAEGVPELEVTDGWYRLRAEVDAPLVRAIRRGVIRVGRKMGVVDAKLVSERKEPSEILQAYDNVKLSLRGNSTHLVPWHAKLGFRRCASVCTLSSLTPDGGGIAMIKLRIENVYPVAYLEFFQGEDGKRKRIGPMGEEEETAAKDAWQAKRDVEAHKLWAELKAWTSILEGYADRMDTKFGGRFIPGEDDTCPETIEDLYDQLEGFSRSQSTHSRTEELNPLSRVTAKDAGWLSWTIRENIAKEKERARDEIETELNSLYPPRDVKGFRVVVVRDAHTDRKPTNRTAQITVWDVMNLVHEEGGERGGFKVGQTFLVTNLLPNQPGSWMDPSSNADGIVYLTTGRRTRWTLCQR